jgi:polysaccharide chain length determinant protein (PEP-CTERM system associated)
MFDTASVPRRSYDFEDYIDILRRNLRWILAPAFAGLVIATVIAYSKEDKYISSASIRVVPQQVSPEVVKSLTTQDMADRINGMAQSILSRATLTSIINNFGLYKSELKKEPMEDVIDKMRGSIPIRPTEGIAASGRVMPAMQISFVYPDKYLAQKVCADLVTRFIDASSQGMNESTQAVHSFIQDELKQAKSQLDELDQKLTDFRTKNAGRLPEEMQMNLQQMNALEGRLGAINEALNRNTEQRMMLESQLNMAKDRMTAVKSPSVMAHNDKINELSRQIENLDLSILSMKDRYTEDYPDLQAARDRLAFLQKQLDAAKKEKVASDSSAYDPVTATPERMNAQDQLTSLNTQMKALNMEAAQYRRDMAATNAAIRQFQSRLQGIPAGEKEYSDLLRDRDMARAKYLELAANRARSVMAMNLEQRRQGETLELIDPASLPSEPFAPKRTTYLPMGAMIGMAIGVVIVAVREMKDTSLKNLKDARMYTQLNILGSVPLLENDVVVQRRKQMVWVGWTTATLAGLAIMTASVARYYLAKG